MKKEKIYSDGVLIISIVTVIIVTALMFSVVLSIIVKMLT